jgi:hypothetical protein
MYNLLVIGEKHGEGIIKWSNKWSNGTCYEAIWENDLRSFGVSCDDGIFQSQI